ncbi:DUF938 domain-containing protein [Microbulbifer flavimaris]|uniref:DUF938 domain-containing protein n=1 Tax=Microbulbifer flavimaris TaxID=1781068 RepID=A0ABX4I1D7_9GAMM|nr:MULTISPECIES: DUF938 domain-containing protein [Microbulbifer]KUJ83958.1 methylase [Microbulbifer sp. ZGT114]PCO06136.1 DUF938 domain-containing protein [Microbulbifer flavimaris]
MSDAGLPDAPACARNRDPILAALRRLLAESRQLLEIGSGTGQHAVYFAPEFPHLDWQASDLAGKLTGIRRWLEACPSANLPPPVALDVEAEWPALTVDTVFTANTLHILSETAVESLFRALPDVLAPGGRLIAYGPFRDGDDFGAESNREFDAWLRQRDPASGIRDLDWLDALALAVGMVRSETIAMPANNRLVVWRRSTIQMQQDTEE